MLRVALALAFSLAVPSFASAQSDLLIVSGQSEPANGRALRRWVSALRHETGAAHVRRLRPTDCAPERDPACATRLTRSSGAARMLLVRVFYERAACVPIHDATSRITGSRMLRTTIVDLTVLDGEGRTIAHQTRPAEVPDADRPAVAMAFARALGL